MRGPGEAPGTTPGKGTSTNLLATDGIPTFGSQPGDIELATWAFKEWERSAGGPG